MQRLVPRICLQLHECSTRQNGSACFLFIRVSYEPSNEPGKKNDHDCFYYSSQRKEHGSMQKPEQSRLYHVSCRKACPVSYSFQEKASEQDFLRKRCVKNRIYQHGWNRASPKPQKTPMLLFRCSSMNKAHKWIEVKRQRICWLPRARACILPCHQVFSARSM